MKVVHHNKDLLESGNDILGEAEKLEKQGELDKAATLYLRFLRKLPGNEHAFSRLMVIYRKQEDAKKELEIINRAIETFKSIFKKHLRATPTKKAVEISKKIMKAMGLVDKKGNQLYEREPLKKWKKRKDLLLARMKKKKTAKVSRQKKPR